MGTETRPGAFFTDTLHFEMGTDPPSPARDAIVWILSMLAFLSLVGLFLLGFFFFLVHFFLGLFLRLLYFLLF
jgi:hypothetical protein